jgi:5'-3' exonuclease
MGIHNLSKFLRKNCPQVFVEAHLSQFQYQKGAIDISLFIFKYYTIFGPRDWINAFLNLLRCLRRNNIHLCFIYDTKAPKEKEEEREKRREQRDKLDAKIEDLIVALEKAKMTGEIDQILKDLIKDDASDNRKRLMGSNLKQKHFNLDDIENEVERIKKQSVKLTAEDFIVSKKVFDLLGIPYFQAPAEAETTCSDLCKRGKVDFAITEDSDVFAYGCKFVFTKINTSTDTCICVKYDDILQALDFTSQQFLDFCIMCGTDYNKNIKNIGPEKSFKLLKQFNSIEGIEKSGMDVSILKFKRVRELFTDYEICNEEIRYCSPPEFLKLNEFLMSKNIRYNIDLLKKDLTFEPLFVFEE